MTEAPSQGVQVILGFDKLYTWKRRGGKTVAEEGRPGEAPLTITQDSKQEASVQNDAAVR